MLCITRVICPEVVMCNQLSPIVPFAFPTSPGFEGSWEGELTHGSERAALSISLLDDLSCTVRIEVHHFWSTDPQGFALTHGRELADRYGSVFGAHITLFNGAHDEAVDLELKAIGDTTMDVRITTRHGSRAIVWHGTLIHQRPW